jgi:ABC-2 type transport system ATP-binding protein
VEAHGEVHRVADTPAILTEGLKKRFGEVEALKGVDLQVPTGSVLGMLGPNGAGKTTTVRILTTLLTPDEGRAEVAGLDVVRDAARLRFEIGLAGQNAAVDEILTGRENLEMVGRLYHLGKQEARKRADEILEQFGLAHAANRAARTYSGGMRRRLDLGASLVGRARILFLDEPTTGLDPRGRLGLWDVIKELVAEGTTLLLTTQYLDEAEVLSDRIVVIDGGTAIAEGTADELKTQVGGDVVALRLLDQSRSDDACGLLVDLGVGGTQLDKRTGTINIPVKADGPDVMAEAIRRLDAGGIRLEDLQLRRPTLDDVFLTLTGHGAEASMEEEDEAGQAAPANGRRGRRRARA